MSRKPYAAPRSAPSKKIDLPKSFELYVEGAKWVVAIVAGLLAFGLAALDAHPGHVVPLILFSCAATALAISGAASLVYLLFSYTYAGLRQSGRPTSDIEVVNAKNVSDIAFPVMVWAIGIGLIVFVGFEAAHLWTLRESDEPIIVHRGTCGEALLVQRGDKLWTLDRTRNGAYVWVRLPASPK